MKMKPCKRCNSTGVLINTSAGGSAPGGPYICCEGCEGLTPDCETMEEAVEAWNRGILLRDIEQSPVAGALLALCFLIGLVSPFLLYLLMPEVSMYSFGSFVGLSVCISSTIILTAMGAARRYI